MDEPTTDLDPVGKLGIFTIAKELHQTKDLTLIIIEHETEEALNADRLIIMDGGKIIADGRPQNVLREIELTDQIGIMSLQIPKYFSQVTSLKKEELPLTTEEGYERFKDLNLQIDESKYGEILEKDREREGKYGEVLIDVQRLEHTYPNGKQDLKGCRSTGKRRGISCCPWT